jgi:hypothetical protein
MKRMFFLMLILLTFLVSLPRAGFADSPVTSTSFSQAYADIDLVQQAAEQGIMDKKLATYLASPKNPIDIKAAIINALSWSTEGKNNADIYASLIYRKKITALHTHSLSGDELFVIGYLLLMDDYMHPLKALPYLEKAKQKKPTSFTIAIIHAISKAQHQITCDVWKNIDDVLHNPKLTRELRQEAIDIIADYLYLYEQDKCEEKPIIPPPVNVTVKLKDTSIHLTWNHSARQHNLDGYLIYRSSDDSQGDEMVLTDFPVIKNEYNDTNIESGTTYTYKVQPIYSDGTKAPLSKPVSIKADLSNKSKTIILQIGNKYMTVNGVKKEMDPGRNTAPVVIQGRTLLPIRALIEEMGGTVDWDPDQEKISISARGAWIEMWLNEKTIQVNQLRKTIDVPPQLVKTRTMVPLRFITEELNCNVKWDGKTNKITIQYE